MLRKSKTKRNVKRSGRPSRARVMLGEYCGTGTGSGIVNTGLAFTARTASAMKSVAVHTSSTTSKAGRIVAGNCSSSQNQ